MTFFEIIKEITYDSAVIIMLIAGIINLKQWWDSGKTFPKDEFCSHNTKKAQHPNSHKFKIFR